LNNKSVKGSIEIEKEKIPQERITKRDDHITTQPLKIDKKPEQVPA
jgi:hypothetical protein